MPEPVAADIAEARALRDEAASKLHEVKQQKPEVIELAKWLARRRGENHFADLLNFQPRGR